MNDSRIGSLCSGYEGLSLAVQAVLGGDLAFVADNDPGAARILAHHYPDVPNYGDITVADWAATGPVDILTAGFPCQDVSCAGARKGLRAGNRTGVWAYVAQAIAALQPSLVLLENVRGLLSAGADSNMELCPWCMGEAGNEHALRAAGAVLGDLADLGFDAEWAVVSAADAGAPHRRERVFILAWPAPVSGDGTSPGPSAADAWRGERRQPAPGQAESGRSRADTRRPGGAPAADADHHAARTGREPGDTGRCGTEPAQCRGTPADTDSAPGGRHEPRSGPRPVQGAAITERAPQQPGRLHSGSGDQGAMATADAGRPRLVQHTGEPPSEEAGPLAGDEPSGDRGLRPATDWGPYGPAIARWEAILGRSAPRPTEPGRTGERLSPAFVEFLMGLPEGWVTGVPGLSRNDQLRALGNGVVPAQGEAAIRSLLERAPEALGPPRQETGAENIPRTLWEAAS